MKYQKSHQNNSTTGRAQKQSLSRAALVYLKLALGDDVTKRVDADTPPLGEGITDKRPLRKPGGGRYTWGELLRNRDLIKKLVFSWRRRKGGALDRRHKRGTKKYQHEMDVEKKVFTTLQRCDGAGWDVRFIDETVRHGMFVCDRPTALGSKLRDKDDKLILGDWSNRLPQARSGQVTQSEAAVWHEPSSFRGGTYEARLLSGPLQFVNHACHDCATHTMLNFGFRDGGLQQRAAQLMPGTEITIDYGIEEYNKWCRGPKCQRDKWDFIPAGSVWKGFEVCEEGVFVPK